MDLLLHAASVPADRSVLVSGPRAWTRDALRAAVAERAAELRAGSRPGAVRPLTVHPDPSGVVELLAAWDAGAVPAPLSPQLTAAEVESAVSALGTADATGGVPDGTAAILWTSGTSGVPRGVALTWAGLLASARGSRERLSLGPADVWYASLSLAHVGGLALVVRSFLLGATLVAEGAFDLERVVPALRGQGAAPAVTHLSLVPTQLLRLLDAWGHGPPPSSLRCVLMGGAATPEPLLRRALEAGWPVALTYGMTEMTSQVATAPPERVRENPGVVGRPLPGVELRLAPDGEILVRGETLAAGLVGTDRPLLDREGWYHSGDLGNLNESGELRIVGRKSDRIMSGGVTVDPYEVEAVLRGNSAVRDVCVAGIADPEWGERVAALVVPAEGIELPGGLEDWARARLGGARLPRLWAVADALPLNRNGKVDRAAVRALLAGGRDLGRGNAPGV